MKTKAELTEFHNFRPYNRKKTKILQREQEIIQLMFRLSKKAE